MRNKKKILFITGTRADFGKLQSLIEAVETDAALDAYIFVTGMHMEPKHGGTEHEVQKCGYTYIYTFINQRAHDTMEVILSNTIQGLGNYVNAVKPDLMVVHGDRVEALAGALVGALNNIIVAHIEGGEVSGTIDESIRHAVSKMAHIHFVANEDAKRRLIQMGEKNSSIYVIGSPDIDLMTSARLPALATVKEYYAVPFDTYGIFMYHPVTTSLHNLLDDIRQVMRALVESQHNYIAIYPNNDPGSDIIIEEIDLQKENPRFRIFPSIRFESFLVLMRHALFIIGNSSSGIREAPFYSVPTINIGNRQNRRFSYETICNVDNSKPAILKAIEQAQHIKSKPSQHFGQGNSTASFMEIIKNPLFWDVKIQKYFIDLESNQQTSA